MTRVRLAIDGAVGRITLARPEKKNALDRTAAEELSASIRAIDRDANVRVLLLAAEGRDFCAGADLAALASLIDAPPEVHHDDAMALGEVYTALRALRVPSIAAVRGRALAGGAGLATACDIVLAEEGAQFGYPEVRVGFVPAMVMTMLRRAVGEKVAFELVATGRLIEAREAQRVGLITRVIDGGELDAAAESLAQKLAQVPPNALRLTKRLLYDLDGLPFRDGIALGARVNVEARATQEFRDGVRRFVDRGKGGT